tara:strand:+ start:930 stop:1184 length:255 start_codon:yes stop_codon:yes gene_type:complete
MKKVNKETQSTEQEVNDPIISLNGTDYKYSEMDDTQKVLVNHVADLTSKLNSALFGLDQLKFSKKAFEDELQKQLEEPAVIEEE